MLMPLPFRKKLAPDAKERHFSKSRRGGIKVDLRRWRRLCVDRSRSAAKRERPLCGCCDAGGDRVLQRPSSLDGGLGCVQLHRAGDADHCASHHFTRRVTSPRHRASSESSPMLKVFEPGSAMHCLSTASCWVGVMLGGCCESSGR
jgi:hypothetical protein